MREALRFDLAISAGEIVRVEAGGGLIPLRHINKSNVRFNGRGRSKEYKLSKTYERAIAAAAQEQYSGQPTKGDQLVVFVDIRLGLLVLAGRRYTGKGRAKKNDVDGIKGILDALNGIVWDDDRQIETVIARLRARDDEAEGDLVTIEIVIPEPSAQSEG